MRSLTKVTSGSPTFAPGEPGLGGLPSRCFSDHDPWSRSRSLDGGVGAADETVGVVGPATGGGGLSGARSGVGTESSGRVGSVGMSLPLSSAGAGGVGRTIVGATGGETGTFVSGTDFLLSSVIPGTT